MGQLGFCASSTELAGVEQATLSASVTIRLGSLQSPPVAPLFASISVWHGSRAQEPPPPKESRWPVSNGPPEAPWAGEPLRPQAGGGTQVFKRHHGGEPPRRSCVSPGLSVVSALIFVFSSSLPTPELKEKRNRIANSPISTPCEGAPGRAKRSCR